MNCQRCDGSGFYKVDQGDGTFEEYNCPCLPDEGGPNCDCDPCLIDRIQAIRTQNNQHWCDLMRLAVEAEPQRAKAILRNIERCDTEVREAMKELSES